MRGRSCRFAALAGGLCLLLPWPIPLAVSPFYAVSAVRLSIPPSRRTPSWICLFAIGQILCSSTRPLSLYRSGVALYLFMSNENCGSCAKCRSSSCFAWLVQLRLQQLAACSSFLKAPLFFIVSRGTVWDLMFSLTVCSRWVESSSLSTIYFFLHVSLNWLTDVGGRNVHII